MNSPSNPSRTSPRHWLSLLALLLALNWAASVCAQSYVLTNLWSAAPLTNTIFNNDGSAANNTRGIAYNPVTDHLLVVSREAIPDFGTNVFGTNGIYIVNAATGVVQGKLAYDTNLITGGNFAVNMVAVTDDGVIYVGNLTAATANGLFRLYRWANENAQPTLAYAGDPSGLFQYGSGPQRFGDSMALRGTGANTQILLGTPNQTLAVLSTTDGVNFTSRFIATTMGVGDSQKGVAWGPGNTCYVKYGNGNGTTVTTTGHLRQLDLDPAKSIATVITNIAAPATATYGGPVDVDLSRHLMSYIDTVNHKLYLFDITDPSNPIQQDVTKSFPTANANGNLVGSVALRNGKLFALDSNNGLLAYTLGQTNLPAKIVTSPATITLWQGAPSYTLTATYGGTPPFTYQWQLAGTNLPGATQASLTLNNISFNHAGAYRVAVSNALGGAVSASATLTITPNATSGVVTKLWDLQAGSRPYLTYRPPGESDIGYKEYGVAINPVNTNIIVVTRLNPTNMIAVLDKQGNFLHYIDYSGLSVPISGLPMNKVDVADDGVVYVGNFYNSSSADTTFNIYAFDEGGNGYGKWIAYKGDPANGQSTGTTGRSTNSWGYSFSVRGSGANTQILLGSSTSNLRNFAILRDDGSGMGSFKSTFISVTDPVNVVPLGFSRLGMDWGPSENTVLAKTSTGNLILLSYDLGDGTNGTATAITYIPQTVSLPNIMRTVPSSATQIKYDPLTGLLGCLRNGSPPSPVSVGLYDVADIQGVGPFQVDQEFFTTYNSDIEFLGSMDFAKGYLVTLGLNNGLMMFRVNTGTASLPVILSQPASVSTFVGLSPALKVVADDATGVMSYQWYLNGQSVPGATDATYTLTNVQTNQAGVYTVRVSSAGGYRESAPALVTVTMPYNTAQMTKVWSLSPGDPNHPYLTTSYYEYGMAFNPATSNLLVVSYDGVAPYVAVVDALTGAHKTNLNVNGVNVGSGKGLLHKIGVADDGVVYGCKQGTPSVSVPAVVYRWANDSGDPEVVPTIAFSGDPLLKSDPSDYSGLTFGVRGAGTNTQIILGSYSNAVAILTTTDGTNFVSNEIKVSGAPYKFCRLGLCWGAGNTFWSKSFWADPAGSQLNLVQFDLAAGTGTILKNYASGLPSSSSITSIAYDDTLQLLAGIGTDTASDSVQVFDLSDLTAGPQLRDQELFPTANPSIEQNGSLAFGLGHTYLFALAENNGVMAFSVNAKYSHFKVLNVTPAPGSVALTWEAVSGATYQVQRATTANGTWTDLGSAVTATGDTASYTDTTPDPKMSFYRVVLK